MFISCNAFENENPDLVELQGRGICKVSLADLEAGLLI